MHLLQICNVGNICGGTAACTWTITCALPHLRHTVVFRSSLTPETTAAFRRCRVEYWRRIDADQVARIDPDVVLLHNIPADACDPLDAPLTIQYLHSRISPAPANVTVACSRWLRGKHPAGAVDGVLYQPVMVPQAPPRGEVRTLRSELIVGRLCTPIARKWPRAILALHADLARAHPAVAWEFVGAPREMQGDLQGACGGRARFLPAEADARRHLCRWDALLYHHPTLEESFGRTVAEALLAGCIPIVDARGGFQEQVSDQTGFLCRSPLEFSNALAALADRGVRRGMSRAARVSGEARFSCAAFARRWRALLEAAAAELAPRADP